MSEAAVSGAEGGGHFVQVGIANCNLDRHSADAVSSRRLLILIRPDQRIYMILLCLWFQHTARDPVILRRQIE